MKIPIGADEIILWLRKNNRKSNIQTITLGRNIHDLIVKELEGNIETRDQQCTWDTGNEDIVNASFLPATSAQYLLDVNKIKQLYEVLMTW